MVWNFRDVEGAALAMIPGRRTSSVTARLARGLYFERSDDCIIRGQERAPVHLTGVVANVIQAQSVGGSRSGCRTTGRD